MKTKLFQRDKVSFEARLLAVLITSYFFCLPLGRFSIGFFNTDFRLFDFTIFFFILFSFNTGLFRRIFWVTRVKAFFPYYLKWLALLVMFSLFFSVLYSRNIAYMLPTLIRVYRFLSYLYTGAAVIAIVNTTINFKFIFSVIMLNVWIQSCLGFLQGIGVLDTFWPDYWNQMYSNVKAPVATLSPHHKHIGVVMLVGLALTLGLIKYYRSRIWYILPLVLLCFIQLSVPLFSGTRTFMLGLAALVLAYIRINKAYSFIALSFLIIIGGYLLTRTNGKVIEKISAKFEERVTGRVQELGYEGLYGERTIIYYRIGLALIEHPYILVTGTGFQNIHSFIPANGAHNNYLQVLMELGIFGFAIFLFFIWKTHKNLLQTYRLISSKYIRAVVSHIWIAFVGVIATMFVGETIWGQAAMFTLAGQLIAILGLGVAPLFWAVMKSAGHHYAQNSDFIR
ncbi:MAG: hypothetical protein KIPDCIKN_03890 [Haliscomenobacter sp.]|nr:hypothetical protein [Haliscomenobacter sp.]